MIDHRHNGNLDKAQIELPVNSAKEILKLLEDNDLLYDEQGQGLVLKPCVMQLERYVNFKG